MINSRLYTFITYIIFMIGIFTGGFITLAAVILAYIHNPEDDYDSHLYLIIKVFWIYFIGSIFTVIPFIFLSEFWQAIFSIVFLIISLYCLVKLITGFRRLLSGDIAEK